MDITRGIYFQAELAGRDIAGIERIGLVRRLAELGYGQSEENVVHRRVAGDAHFEDIVCIDGGFFAEPGGQVIYAINYGFLKLGEFFVGPGVCDSADDIVAEAGLRIECGFGGPAPAAGHVDEPGDNGGCAEIDGQAEYRLGRVGMRIFFIYVTLNPRPGIDTFGQNPLLEEPGAGGDRHYQIAFDSILAGEDLPCIRLEIDQAFFACTFAAANGVQDNTGLARSLYNRRARVN